MIATSKTVASAFVVLLASTLFAAQGSLTNSGGSTSVDSEIGITSEVLTPEGTLKIDCPLASPSTCVGGSFAFASGDGTLTITASFTLATLAKSCSGGGRFVRVRCTFSFAGDISGTLTQNGVSQSIIGNTHQGFSTGGAAARGVTVYNSAYSPFYYSDTEQLHRSDDLQGTNQVSFGSQGSDIGQFYGAYGIALDSAGRIYVADTYNCRIVRIDDMTGSNWTSLGDGNCAPGQGEFNDPSGIAVDSAGRIYVADTGNSRVVRIDDMNGANWISYGTAGSGVGEFSGSVTSVAVDSGGYVYIPDTGNARLVRMDDMNGTNWTELTQFSSASGALYSLESPVAVAFDSAGRIYLADNEYFQPAVIRVDDMSGASPTLIRTGSGSGLNSISVDSGGTVFVGGGGVKLIDDMAGVLTSSDSIGPLGSYYVFGVTAVPSPPASAVSAASR